MASEDFSNLDEETMFEILAKSSRAESFTFTDVAKGAGTHEEACDETSLLGLTTNEDVPVEADSVPYIPVSVNEPHVPNHEEFSTLDVMNSGLNTSVTYQEPLCERPTNSTCVKSFSAVAKAAGTREEICDDTSLNRGTTNRDDHALECDETSLPGQDMNEDVPDAVEADPVPLFLFSVNDPTVLDYEATDTSNRAYDGGIVRKVEGTVNQKVNCFDQNEDVCGGVDGLNPISVAESCYRSKQMPRWNITEGCLDGASDTALAGNASRGAFKYEWDLNVSDCDDSNVFASIEYTSESPSKTASIEEGQYKFDLNSIPVDDDSQSSDGWLNHYMDNPTLAALFSTKQPWPTASNLFTEIPSSNTNGVESSNGSSNMDYSSITSGTEYVGTSVPTLGSSSCTTWMMKRKETDWALRPCSSKRQQLI